MEVHLAENPSTGYRWVIEHSSGPEVIKDEYISDRPPGPWTENTPIGGGGTRILTIQGTGEIRLVYCHPWDHSTVIDRRTYKLP